MAQRVPLVWDIKLCNKPLNLFYPFARMGSRKECWLPGGGVMINPPHRTWGTQSPCPWCFGRWLPSVCRGPHPAPFHSAVRALGRPVGQGAARPGAACGDFPPCRHLLSAHLCLRVSVPVPMVCVRPRPSQHESTGCAWVLADPWGWQALSEPLNPRLCGHSQNPSWPETVLQCWGPADPQDRGNDRQQVGTGGMGSAGATPEAAELLQMCLHSLLGFYGGPFPGVGLLGTFMTRRHLRAHLLPQ